MTAQLWQILLKLQKEPAEADLTCDECFVLLDYLVSQIVAIPHSRSLQEVAHKHFQYCPNCREHHLQKLKVLEADYLHGHEGVKI